MLKNKTDIRKRDVELVPKSILVFFSDIGDWPLALELPSAKELMELRSGYSEKYSVKEVVKLDPFGAQVKMESEYERVLSKYDRFSSSSTYLMNLYGLGRMAGRFDEAREYLRQALEIDDVPSIKHELGDLLIDNYDLKSAEELFSQCELDNDVYANLRMAFLCIKKGVLDSAEEYVRRGLIVDCLDYRARMFSGALHLAKSEYELAIRDFKVAELSNQKSSVLFVNRAVAHMGLNDSKSALKALRRAVAIDPLNENAVAFYADLLFLDDKEDKSIACLESFLKYEQKSESIWALLARAYYKMGQKSSDGRSNYRESLEALKHQLNVNSSPTVWNNMGLASWGVKDYSRAKRYLAQSMKLALESGGNEWLAAYNMAGLLIDRREYKEAMQLTSSALRYVDLDGNLSLLQSRLCLQYVVTLEALGKRKESASFIEKLVEIPSLDLSIKIDLMSRLVYHYTITVENKDAALGCSERLLESLESADTEDVNIKLKAFNNTVFAFLNFDQFQKAHELLSRLSEVFHKDAYSTATLGMYHLRKRNFEKGEILYKEAISMVLEERTKDRFKQRMNYEFGIFYLERGDYKSAQKYFNKARKLKNGLKEVNEKIGLLTKDTKSPSLKQKTE
ncbi:MAG: tetratricopeptide repeat protein [Candidatus Thiodiazotropha sp.]